MEKITIKEFYKGKNVFVTGATGFIGKTLVEKLLWSCPDIKNIYIIVRSKKGKAVQERVDEITNSPAFDRIRAKNPESLNKIIALEGDITNENLGMSNEDLAKFYDNVNLIFHAAASIRMDEPIKDAVNNNTIPTKRLIAMAKKIKDFDAFVHISTAFSNFYRENLHEIPYLPSYDPNDIIKLTQSTPENIQLKLEPFLLNSINSSEKANNFELDKTEFFTRPFPNTYTFSKYFAEAFVTLEGEGIPRAIVRPSLVISSVNEPMKGWIDNWGGPTERLGGVAGGLIRHINADPGNFNLDVVPVDYTVNCAIVAGCKTAIEKSKNVQVFNASTGTSNGITTKRFFDYIQESARKYPFDKVMWWPTVKFTDDRVTTKVLPFIYHTLPASLIDLGRMIKGKNPFMIKLYNKLDEFYKIVHFAARDYHYYHNNNAQKLSQSLSKSDQKEFPFDMRTINWKECVDSYVLGVKKYLLKEDCSAEAIKKGQIKMQKLKFLHNGTKFFFIGSSLLIGGGLIAGKLKGWQQNKQNKSSALIIKRNASFPSSSSNLI